MKKMCQYSSSSQAVSVLKQQQKTTYRALLSHSVLQIPHEQQEFGQDLTGFCLSAQTSLASSLLSLLRCKQPGMLLGRRHSSAVHSVRPALHSGVGHSKDQAAQSDFSSPLWSMSKGKNSMCNPFLLIQHQVEKELSQSTCSSPSDGEKPRTTHSALKLCELCTCPKPSPSPRNTAFLKFSHGLIRVPLTLNRTHTSNF